MARILHIDTSGPVALVMLAVGGSPIGHRISGTERDHAARLNLIIEELLTAAGMRLADVDAVAVCNGPGSYTGLRIGLATAKGFCYALQKPLLLHNKLLLMLHELENLHTSSPETKLAVLPARTGEYYVAAEGSYSASPGHIETNVLLDECSNAGPINIIGKPGKDLESLPITAIFPHEILDVSVWAAITHKAFIKAEWADLAYCVPEYLKSAYITVSRTDR